MCLRRLHLFMAFVWYFGAWKNLFDWLEVQIHYTPNPKIDGLEMFVFFQGAFFRFRISFRGCNGKLVVWAGVILGVPLSNNPFHKGILAIQTTNLPSIKQSRVWGDTPADPDVVIGSRGIPITARIIPTYSNILLSSADVLFVTIRSARIPIMKHYSLYGNSIMFHYLAKQKRITISHSLKPSA